MRQTLVTQDETRRLKDELYPVDHVREYEARWFLRTLAEQRLRLTKDETDPLVQLGRPTGP